MSIAKDIIFLKKLLLTSGSIRPSYGFAHSFEYSLCQAQIRPKTGTRSQLSPHIYYHQIECNMLTAINVIASRR